ncbi:MAG: hypothetical protein CL862_04420 [Cyanobium sp. NAT70]|jgi:hypothetical protein|nr:hypothetical protein [Cyanobium sp. NAT70]|tara:strand:- start:8691 stop:9134 length:444 start_codon:yes stop_codon:yes gene_type:complete
MNFKKIVTSSAIALIGTCSTMAMMAPAQAADGCSSGFRYSYRRDRCVARTDVRPGLRARRRNTNGQNVMYVSNSERFFRAIPNSQFWLMKMRNGEKYIFREMNRDQWSVYLQNERGVQAQLDLHTRKITYSIPGIEPLYFRIGSAYH